MILNMSELKHNDNKQIFYSGWNKIRDSTKVSTSSAAILFAHTRIFLHNLDSKYSCRSFRFLKHTVTLNGRCICIFPFVVEDSEFPDASEPVDTDPCGNFCFQCCRDEAAKILEVGHRLYHSLLTAVLPC